MQDNEILTRREREVINKKLSNSPLTQQDSNYLSRFVRPKLRKIKQINPDYLLNRLSYNPKSISINKKIINVIIKNVPNVNSIILIGSAIQTSYTDYNDIDIIVVVKEKFWNREIERIELCNEIEDEAKESGLKLDIQLISKRAFLNGYSTSPSLIYQLKDSKIIYGKIKIPKKIGLSKLDLRMKLDWSDIEDKYSEPKDIYNAIRNTLLVRLLMNKVIDNYQLLQYLISELGNHLITKLKNNTTSELERKMALKYLHYITDKTRKEVINAKWEKLKI